MKEFRTGCSRARKDELIEELWTELRKKDDDYVKMLKE